MKKKKKMRIVTRFKYYFLNENKRGNTFYGSPLLSFCFYFCFVIQIRSSKDCMTLEKPNVVSHLNPFIFGWT